VFIIAPIFAHDCARTKSSLNSNWTASTGYSLASMLSSGLGPASSEQEFGPAKFVRFGGGEMRNKKRQIKITTRERERALNSD